MGTALGRVGGRAGRGVSARKRGSPGPCSSWVASDGVTLNGLGRSGCSGLEWQQGVPSPGLWPGTGGVQYACWLEVLVTMGIYGVLLPARLQVHDLISSPQQFAGNILQMQSETQRGLRTCPEHEGLTLPRCVCPDPAPRPCRPGPGHRLPLPCGVTLGASVAPGPGDLTHTEGTVLVCSRLSGRPPRETRGSDSSVRACWPAYWTETVRPSAHLSDWLWGTNQMLEENQC